VPFEVVVPEVEEISEGDPASVVLGNARRKAQAVQGQVGEGAVVLGVDTDVALDGRLLGKAGSESEAWDRLEALSGRTHEVLSGVVFLGIDGLLADSATNPSTAPGVAERSGVATSYVTFRRLDGATIQRYLASGEWRDRAGAYAIQGLGAILVERLEGDFANVVGLPVGLLQLAPELFATPGRDPEGTPS
jgi:nucleoside triphosphate pyrophosphatase